MCTKYGIIKKTSLEAYSVIVLMNQCYNYREGDTLLEAKLTNGEQDIMMAVRSGKAIRFPESKVRSMGRNASGVRAITVDWRMMKLWEWSLSRKAMDLILW